MPNLTIRDVPPKLLDRLRHRAREDRRSLAQEVIHLLEVALRTEAFSPAAQAERWLRLAGRWRSDRSAKAEIAEIYRARSRGRSVKL